MSEPRHGLRFCGERALFVAVLFVAACNQPPPTQPPSKPPTAEQSRARAIAVTARMLDSYRRADSYADHATYIEESVLRGDGIARELPYFQLSLAFKRPNLVRMSFAEAVADAAGERRGFEVASDGDLLRAAMPEIPDQMVENPAPAELTAENVLADPLIREKLLQRDLGDVFPQLAMLLNKSDADGAAVFPRDSNPRLLGSERLGDDVCYRVATSHPEGTRVLWIDAKDFALRRMELPIESHRERIDPDGHYLRLAVRIDFDNVTFGAEIDPKSFTLSPTEGVRRVRRFVLPDDELTAKDANEEELTAKDAKSAKEEKEITE